MIFFFFNNFGIKKKKKHMQNGVISMVLTAALIELTEPWIDKNWKLEDWIDETES